MTSKHVLYSIVCVSVFLVESFVCSAITSHGQEPQNELTSGATPNRTSDLRWERLELPKGEMASYNPEGERQVFAIQFDPQGRIYIANRYNGHGNEAGGEGGRSFNGARKVGGTKRKVLYSAPRRSMLTASPAYACSHPDVSSHLSFSCGATAG